MVIQPWNVSDIDEFYPDEELLDEEEEEENRLFEENIDELDELEWL